MAKEKPVAVGEVKVLVLTACAYGDCGDVVGLSPEAAALGKKDGVVDDTPAAVAYAESVIAAQVAV